MGNFPENFFDTRQYLILHLHTEPGTHLKILPNNHLPLPSSKSLLVLSSFSFSIPILDPYHLSPVLLAVAYYLAVLLAVASPPLTFLPDSTSDILKYALDHYDSAA